MDSVEDTGSSGAHSEFELTATERKKDLSVRLYALLLCYILLVPAAFVGLDWPSSLAAVIALSSVSLMLGWALAVAARRYDSCSPCLSLSSQALAFPKLFNPYRSRTYLLANLYSVELRRRKEVAFVTLGFRREGRLLLLASWFRSAADFDHFVSLMKAKLELVEDDKSRLQVREELAEAYLRFPHATVILTGLLIATYLIEKLLMESGGLVLELIRLGGMNSYLFFEGEYSRLVTPIFLHRDAMHLISNVFVLVVFANLVEPLLGWARFSLVFLVAGILASLASAYFSGFVVHIGASGAIYGIVGVYLYSRLFLEDQIPASLRVNRPWIFYGVLCLSFMHGYINPAADILTHFVGLVTGMALMHWAGRHRLSSIRKMGIETKLLLPVLAGACVFALAARYATVIRSPADEYADRMIVQVLMDESYEAYAIDRVPSRYTNLLAYIALYLSSDEFAELAVMRCAQRRMEPLSARQAPHFKQALESLSQRIEAWSEQAGSG